MTPQRRKLVAGLVRVTLGTVFIIIAVRGVSCHDRVTLRAATDGSADSAEVICRLLAEDEQSVTVRLPDGTSAVRPRADVAVDAQGDERIERGLGSALQASDLGLLGLALLIFAPVPFIQSWRYQIMLRGQEIHLSYGQCLKLSFAGNFLNFVFMIGSTAGDLYKAYFTALHTPRKTEAVTTILLDRIVGLAGLLLMTTVMIWLGSADPLLRQLGRAALLLLAGLLVGAVVITTPWVRTLAPRQWLARLPGWGQLQRIYGTAERLVHHPVLVLTALLLTVTLQFLAVGAGVMAARALHMDFGGTKMWDYFACISAGHVVAAVPIAPQGLGTVELTYRTFFLDSHGTLSQLLCLALCVRLILFVWSLPGALVTLLGPPRPRHLEPLAESAAPPAGAGRAADPAGA